MANVIKTVFTYPLDGTTTDFTIPFEYLARKFVVITLIGVDRKELIVTTDYRFATRTTISLTRAWGPADNYQQIEIRRYTSATERLVDFSDGSILRASDLNVAQVQTLHVAEEARDLTADTIGVNNDGDLDARGRKIVNLADGVNPGDAVSFGQMDRWTGSALNSANNAKASEVAAKTSETNSKTSEMNAKSSETLAGESQAQAQRWASLAEDSPVTTGQYSAFHWAQKASKSATTSVNSAAAALASQNAAKTSETNSKTSETNAATSAQQAATANPDVQLKKAENLNDVASKSDSRTNLDVLSKGESKAVTDALSLSINSQGGRITALEGVPKILAQVTWTYTGGVFTILLAHNVASVTAMSTGVVRLTFSTAMPNVNYNAVASPVLLSGNMVSHSLGNVAASSIDIITWSGSGTGGGINFQRTHIDRGSLLVTQ